MSVEFATELTYCPICFGVVGPARARSWFGPLSYGAREAAPPCKEVVPIASLRDIAAPALPWRVPRSGSRSGRIQKVDHYYLDDCYT